MEAYQKFVFGLVRGGFLFGIGFALFWSLLGIADLILDLQWGYSWPTLLLGPVFALGCYGGYRFGGVVERIVAGILRSAS